MTIKILGILAMAYLLMGASYCKEQNISTGGGSLDQSVNNTTVVAEGEGNSTGPVNDQSDNSDNSDNRVTELVEAEAAE